MKTGFDVYKDKILGGMVSNLPKYLTDEELNTYIPKKKRVLEIGAGTGHNCEVLKRFDNYVVAADISNSALESIKNSNFADEILLFDASIDRIPFPNESFNHVMMFETLEHLSNPYHCISEAKRVCTINGVIHISIPDAYQQEGYRDHNHAFVYPGLFQIENFRRFLKQMYLEVYLEKMFENISAEHFYYDKDGNRVDVKPAKHYYFACKNLETKYDILEVVTLNLDDKELYPFYEERK